MSIDEPVRQKTVEELQAENDWLRKESAELKEEICKLHRRQETANSVAEQNAKLAAEHMRKETGLRSQLAEAHSELTRWKKRYEDLVMEKNRLSKSFQTLLIERDTLSVQLAECLENAGENYEYIRSGAYLAGLKAALEACDGLDCSNKIQELIDAKGKS